METKRLKNMAYILMFAAVVLIVLFTAMTVLQRDGGNALQQIYITPNANGTSANNDLEGNYLGTMGKDIRVHMHLKIQGELIYGYYYYDIFQKVLILKGTLDRAGSFKIIEYDEKENQTGIFSGQFSEDFETLSGRWLDQNGMKEFPFKMEKMKANEKIVDYLYKNNNNNQ